MFRGRDRKGRRFCKRSNGDKEPREERRTYERGQDERDAKEGKTAKRTGTLVARLLRSPQDIVALVTGFGDSIVLEVELVSVDIALLCPSRESRLQG